jgi:putative nucleotidyltransferase with HDIG domain
MATAAGTPAEAGRWERRPRLALLVRLVVFLAPAIVATDVSLVLTRVLPRPHGVPASLAWWVAVIAGSGLTLLAFDRLFRRLLPLTVLLGLALVFPGVAPSRFSAAFRAGTVRNLQRRIEQAKHDAAHADSLQAASTVVELIGALAIHDPRTRGHSERTRAYADLIAEELGLSSDERDHLRWAALLHDIGKLHVKASVLNKPGKLTAAEWTTLQGHPVEGARIAGALRSWLGPWGLAIEQHHERFDGTGYPAGLGGADISLAGRIVAVADAYEVMTSARTYTAPVDPADAREELVRCAGGHFDPDVVHAFLRIAIGKFPRRVGLLVLLAQVPGAVGVQQLLQQAGSVVAAGTAVAGLAVGGVVVPGAAGLGGLAELGTGRAPATSAPAVRAAGGATRTTAPARPRATGAPPAEAADDLVAPTTTAAPEAPTETTAAPAPLAGVGVVVYFLGTAAPAEPAELAAAPPPDAELGDVDADGAPGRTLAPSPRPATTTDPAQHQRWVAPAEPGRAVRLVGRPTLRIGSATANFEPGRGTLRASLLDCDASGRTCDATPISTASLTQADWSEGSGEFTNKTLTFDATDHVLVAGRRLVLHLGVPNRSDTLLLAYGTQQHPASLTIERRGA